MAKHFFIQKRYIPFLHLLRPEARPDSFRRTDEKPAATRPVMLSGKLASKNYFSRLNILLPGEGFTDFYYVGKWTKSYSAFLSTSTFNW